MDSTLDDRPTLTWQDVALVVARFGEGFELEKMLPSERDQNFLVRRSDPSSGNEERVVFKVHNPNDSADFVELQSLALERAVAAGASCQRLLRTTGSNEAVETLTLASGRACLCRALSFLPGRMLAEAAAAAASEQERAALFAEVGRSVGRVSAGLQGLEHPAGDREFPWDLCACEDVITLRSGDVVAERRHILDGFLERYRARLKPVLGRLRRSIAHNDPNDHNLVVASSGSVGVLDFGDILRTYTVADAAICMAYLLFHISPGAGLLEGVLPFVLAYHAECPLEAAEVDALFGLALMRVCTSVSMSAYQTKLDPDNEYLLISAQPAWKLLERVVAEGIEEWAPAFFRKALGFDTDGSSGP
mmetsp:Transcript_131978/g.422298  ORF Transcript_131978/g.422298 Transcript_131978/m.422298 type:complete len:362 (-) Transcript_131978:229-1314(-)